MKTYTEMHDFLLSVLSSVPYGIIATDMEGYIVMINNKALENLKIESTASKLLERPLVKFISTIPAFIEEIEACIKNGRKEFVLRDVNVYNNYISITGKSIMNGMLYSINDVTNIKQAKNLSTLALIEGQELERHRLSKEIHDGVGPLMSTLKLHVDSIKSGWEKAPEKVVKKIEHIEDLLKTVSSDIRSISHDLMPSALIDFGLTKSLRNLCDNISSSKQVEVSFSQKGIKGRLDKEVELNLYRIAQELLNNALKYAKATDIKVQIYKNELDKIILTVEDDGIGCDLTKLESSGIGLQNLKTRTQLMNGVLALDTQPGKGFSASIEIPYKLKNTTI